MFTGIIEEVGKVISVRRGAHSCVLTVAANTLLDDVHLGDSIATNGVCLTVTEFTKQSFCADVMPETLQRSSLGSLRSGSSVNLERATVALAGISSRVTSMVLALFTLLKKTIMQSGTPLMLLQKLRD